MDCRYKNIDLQSFNLGDVDFLNLYDNISLK